MNLDAGRTLISVPYSYEANDKPVFEKNHWTGEQFGEMIQRQFDVLYREGADSGHVMGWRCIRISAACRIVSRPHIARSFRPKKLRPRQPLGGGTVAA
jgi:hypothetical protein